jgi:hypothetical protein
MRRHIAFLHTSPVHVETFTRLASAAAPEVKVDHVVAEDLLAQAQRAGAGEPALVDRVQEAMGSAADRGAAVVICTCSTIGGAAERTPTGGRFVAMRIDRAMADRAAQLGPRVLVVAALESTLEPTAQLIRESAAAMAAEVELKHLLVEGAWAHFLRQDPVAYAQVVASAVRAAAGTCDVVVLAQASMAPAAAMLADLSVEVLTSPELGVQSALAQLV